MGDDALLDAFLAALAPANQRRGRDGRVKVTCWGHDDKNPSTNVWVDDNGKIAMTCFAGCDNRHLEHRLPPEALRIAKESWGAPTATLVLPRHQPRQPDPTPNGQVTYTYHDEHGNPVGVKVRKPGKKFMWADRKGNPPPYRLPDILAARQAGDLVCVVEGEKDADRLATLGITATTAPDGSKTWNPDYAHWFKDAHVVVIPDNDNPGIAYADEVTASLTGTAATVRYLILPVGPSQDVSDWLDAGHTADELLELANQAEIVGAKKPEWVADWDTVWNIETDQLLVPPMFLKGRGHSLYAQAKTGKSLFLLWLITRQLQRDPHLVVLYLDFEMGQVDLVERLEKMGVYDNQPWLARLWYAMFPPLAPFDTEEGAAELMALIDTVETHHPDAHIMVVIDTISRAVEGEENSADTYRAFYRHTGMKLKARQLTWVRVDHAGKDNSAGQRGSSAKNDDVDVVWELTRLTDPNGDPAGAVIKPTFQRVGNLQTHTYGYQSDPLKFLEAEASAILPADHHLACRAWAAGIRPQMSQRTAWDHMRNNHPEGTALRLTQGDTRRALTTLKTDPQRDWTTPPNTKPATQEEAF